MSNSLFAGAPRPKPNILLIMCDQLRFDSAGGPGPRLVKTPNIDSIARGGLRFTNAYTPQPICCPARQSLLTSRRPERDGFLWNYDIALKVASLEPDPRLWPARLAHTGYRMVYVGKWHESENHSPLDFGYDTYDGDEGYKAFREEAYGPAVYVNGIDGEVDPVPPEGAHTHWLAGLACKRLGELTANDDKRGDCAGFVADGDVKRCESGDIDADGGVSSVTGEPWHMRVDFTEPHPPYRPCAEFAGMYAACDVPVRDSFREDFTNKPYIQKQMIHTWGMENYDWKRWSEIIARYYAVVSQVDDAIGKILRELDRRGCRDNTLVILTTDHGDMCGAHRMIDKHNVLYDDIVHVPLMMRWPGALPAGIEIPAFVHNTLDIGPTILEAVGLSDCANLESGATINAADMNGAAAGEARVVDGRSLFPLFNGDTPSGWRDCAVSAYNGQQFGLYTQRMIRDNDWKYIWNTSDIDELYDMRGDPAELTNRVYDPECAGILKSMRRRLCEILVNEGDGLMKNYWLRDQLMGATVKI